MECNVLISSVSPIEVKIKVKNNNIYDAEIRHAHAMKIGKFAFEPHAYLHLPCIFEHSKNACIFDLICNIGIYIVTAVIYIYKLGKYVSRYTVTIKIYCYN